MDLGSQTPQGGVSPACRHCLHQGGSDPKRGNDHADPPRCPLARLPADTVQVTHVLPVSSSFSFAATVYSHGWCVLAPFGWRSDDEVLERVLRVPGGTTRVAFSQPHGRGTALVCQPVAGRGSRAGLNPVDRACVDRLAARMFRLDADLSTFHALCRRRGGTFARAARAGFGRLLRAPTLFEDVVKILATTNTTWAGTKAMVAKLVTLVGDARGRDGLHPFPSPPEIATLGAERLAAQARWGYRSAYLQGLCERITSGTLDLSVWETWSGTTEALEREIRSVPGLGPYAAAHVLALLGRHDRIGIDTVFRSFVRRTYFPRARKPPPDRRLLEIYEDWGPWRGLAYWADLWYAHHVHEL